MPPYAATALLVLGVLAAWYASAYALADASGELPDTRGGRRGVVTAIPVLLLAVIASAAGRTDVALAASFSAAAAALSLVTGAAFASAPPGVAESELTGGRRAWAFVLPAAVLAFVAGFGGRLTWFHAVCLLLEGVAVWSVWTMPESREARGVEAADAPPLAASQRYKTLQLLLAVLLAALGGWLAVVAVGRAESNLGRPTGVPMAALLLGPALVLPLIGLSGHLAAAGKIRRAAGTQIAFALMCLCAAVPAAVLSGYARHALPVTGSELTQATTSPASRPAVDPPAAALSTDVPVVVFPRAVWRVDAVFLIVLGMLLVPIAAGRLRPSRGLGVALVLAYIVYIYAVVRTH